MIIMTVDEKIKWLVKAENIIANFSDCSCYKREDQPDYNFFVEMLHPEEYEELMVRDKRELEEIKVKVMQKFDELIK